MSKLCLISYFRTPENLNQRRTCPAPSLQNQSSALSQPHRETCQSYWCTDKHTVEIHNNSVWLDAAAERLLVGGWRGGCHVKAARRTNLNLNPCRPEWQNQKLLCGSAASMMVQVSDCLSTSVVVNVKATLLRMSGVLIWSATMMLVLSRLNKPVLQWPPASWLVTVTWRWVAFLKKAVRFFSFFAAASHVCLCCEVNYWLIFNNLNGQFGVKLSLFSHLCLCLVVPR